MSILNDARVQPSGGDGYEVTTDTGTLQVLPSDVLGWGLYHGPRLKMVVTGSGPAIGFESADVAVKAALS